MPEWVVLFFTSVLLPSIISAIGYLSARSQIRATRATEQERIEAAKPTQEVSITKMQSDIYEEIYTRLREENERERASNKEEQAELKRDYEAQIKRLENEIVSLKAEVMELKATVERTYSEDITTRNAAIATLQAEVAELKRAANN